ncbi:MAG: peptide chain release factor N(5)-glutamine methyltransferase [Bacilli bacterium]|jgi:release factor glutamine methyltransferase|nr:peptide chain release factor N(5)-glutamine methyltransferase [Bacilli bacterium]
MPSIYDLYENVVRESEFARKNEIALRALICEIQGHDEMSDFYMKKNEEIRDLPLFRAYLARFLNGEPYQYIIQKACFLKRDFFVDNRVLIPRMETEEVVSKAIQIIKQSHNPDNLTIADIGTGSGIIAITLKKAFPKAKIVATDVSKDALEVTSENAKLHNEEISLIQGDVLEPLLFQNIKIDVLVSNPPYITNLMEIEPSVIKYEPYLALVDSGELSFYKKIFMMYQAICNYPFTMVFEIGHDIKDNIETLIQMMIPKAKWEITKDINNKDRILSIHIEA